MTNKLANEMKQPAYKNITAQTAAVFIFFLIIALIITWPLLPNFMAAFAGGRSDLRVHQWTFWWVKQALLNGENPYFTNLLYYPDGVSLTSHGFAWVSIFVWLLLQTFMGEIVAYNATAVLVITLNGFCMFLLARQLTRSMTAGIVAGVIFAAWPYTISHYDHPNLTMLFWLPLALLALQQLVHKQWWPWALATAVCLALTGLNSWHILLMSGPLLVLWIICLLIQFPDGRSRRLLWLLLGTGAATAVLIFPAAWPVVADLSTSESSADVVFEEPDGGRTDLLAYFMPPNLYDATLGHNVTNPYLGRPYEFIAASTHYVPFIGYLTLLLALIGCLKRWRDNRFWLLAAVFYAGLALGTVLALNGQIMLDWLPYRWLQDTFIGTIIRRPHRLNFLLGLPLAMMAAWGVTVLLPRRQAGKLIPLLMMLGLTAVILVETRRAIPYTTTPYEAPRWASRLATEPGTFGILDLPTHDRRFDKWYMSYQIEHGKPLAVGHVSRLPATAQNFLKSVPFLASFLAHEDRLDDQVADISHQLAQLAEANIRYLVIHKAFVHEGFSLQWRDWLTIEPIYEDEQVVVYETAVQHGRDYTITHPLSSEIGLIRTSVVPQMIVPGGLLKLDLRWGSTAVPPPNEQICVDLQEVINLHIILLGCRSVSSDWPLANWGSDEVVKADYQLPIHSDIPPGQYHILVQLADESEKRIGESATIGQVEIAVFKPQEAVTAVWQNGLQLTQFSSQVVEDNLILDLYWQAGGPTVGSVVIFVHLLDSDTGQLLGQSDAVPHQWQYPTTIWSAGETIWERRSLPLAELPTGRYDVQVGLYDQETGERVTAVAKDNATTATVYLTTIQR